MTASARAAPPQPMCPTYEVPSHMVPLPLAPTLDPGGLSGELTVTDSGAAKYTLPIVVPAGRNGFQPELEVTYSSSGGTGIMGIGFGITGPHVVERCGSSIALDGHTRAVSLGPADNFCFDGARLWPVDRHTEGPYSVTEYRTRPDSLIQFLAYTAPGSASPEYFVARTPEGNKLALGLTPAARAFAPGGVPMQWMLEQKSDRFNNLISYTYTKTEDVDGHTRELLLDSIEYGGNAAGGPSHTRKIRFDYLLSNPLYTQEQHFRLGFSVTPRTARLLTGISTEVLGKRVRRYEMAYEATSGGQRVLSEIRVRGTDKTWSRPVRFAWEGLSDGDMIPREDTLNQITMPCAECNMLWRIGDFDGDGTSDILTVDALVTDPTDDDHHRVFVFKVQRNTDVWAAPFSIGFGSQETWATVALLAEDAWDDWGVPEVQLTDFDADGRTDVLIDHPGLEGLGRRALVSTGSAFVETNSGMIRNYFSRSDEFHPADQSGWMLGDLNGDGMPDLLECVEPRALIGNANYVAYNCEDDSDFLIASVFQNGTPTCRPSLAEWTVRLWTPGSGYQSPEIPIPGLTGTTCRNVAESGVHILDWNSDGQNEILALQNTTAVPGFSHGWVTHQLDPRYNTWLTAELAATPPPMQDPQLLGWPRAARSPHWENIYHRIYFPDVNGDRLPDLVYMSSPSKTQIQTGDDINFITRDGDYPLPATFSEPWLMGHTDMWMKHGVQVYDYNQDGRDDLLIRAGANNAPPIVPGDFDLSWSAFISHGTNAPPAEIPGIFLDPVYVQNNSTWVTQTCRRWVPPVGDCCDNMPCGPGFCSPGYYEHYDCSYEQTSYSVSSPTTAVADLNADGRPDILSGDQVFFHPQPQIRLSKVWSGNNNLDGPMPFWNSEMDSWNGTPGDPDFEPDVWVTYDNLVDPTLRAPSANWTGAMTYQARFTDDCEYPRACVVGAQTVVDSYSINNGKNERRMRRMMYRDARADRIGGMIGFNYVMFDDWQRGELSIRHYNTTAKHPVFGGYTFSGVPDKTWTVYRGTTDNPASDMTRVDLLTSQTTRLALFTADAHSYTLVDDVVRTTTELGSLSDPSDYNALLAFVLSPNRPTVVRKATRVDYSDFDDYGLPRRIESEVDGVDQIDETVLEYENDEGIWQLSRLASETKCSSVGPRSECRRTEYTYEPSTGALVEVRRAPDDYAAFLRTNYEYDAFGNLVRERMADAHGNSSNRCISYDEHFIHPFATVNLEGHTALTIYDPRLGVVVSSRDPNNLVTKKEYDGHGNLVAEHGPDGLVTTA